MRYLVDANVLSEATKPDPDQRVVEWLRRNERQLVIDPVVLGEVRFHPPAVSERPPGEARALVR